MIEFREGDLTDEDWFSPQVGEEKFYLAFSTIAVVGAQIKTDIQSDRLFRWAVHDICEIAPNIAVAVATLIQEYIETNKGKEIVADSRSSPDRETHSEEERTRYLTRRKRKPQDDGNYRPPKGFRTPIKLAREKPLKHNVSHTSESDFQEKSRNTKVDENKGREHSVIESRGSSPKVGVQGGGFTSATELTFEMVSSVYQFDRYHRAIPREVHSRILYSLQRDRKNLGYTDGAMWMQVLEMGTPGARQGIIFHMLELVGAWEWYKAQIEHAQANIRTTKGDRITPRMAAIHVRNVYITGVGSVDLEKGTQVSTTDPFEKRLKEKRRQQISVQLQRGRKMERLTAELGFGILFSRDIWSYVKMDENQLELLISGIKADQYHMALLRCLDSQLESLVNKGKTDFPSFLSSLVTEGLLSSQEALFLSRKFPFSTDKISKEELDNAVDRLIDDVKTHVLGKDVIDKTDSVLVDNGVELLCSSLHQLRDDRWFDSWMIMAAMQISDKPPFVQCDYSIPLDDKKHDTLLPIPRPFAAWKRKIIGLRQENEKNESVYFRPLNHANEHFSLLEINERSKVIRHYDSLASQNAIKGSALTRVERLVKEEFGDMKYEYSEVATPQQRDSWSCGARVVWNFRRVANGLLIGDWNEDLCPRRMKLEITDGFLSCVRNNCMQKSVLSVDA